jgi:hypothetical protein
LSGLQGQTRIECRNSGHPAYIARCVLFVARAACPPQAA